MDTIKFISPHYTPYELKSYSPYSPHSYSPYSPLHKEEYFSQPLSPIFKMSFGDVTTICLTPDSCSSKLCCPFSTTTGKCKNMKCFCMKNLNMCTICKLTHCSH